MSHMRCKDHERRVVEVSKLSGKTPGGTIFYHRNGDGSKCDSEIIICGTVVYARHPLWHKVEKTTQDIFLEFLPIINSIYENEAERILRERKSR